LLTCLLSTSKSPRWRAGHSLCINKGLRASGRARGTPRSSFSH
jgi:hypothetical protein